VHVSGLPKCNDPSDEEIETLLNARYNLSDNVLLWAGPDTTLIKRDEEGTCRGYAFLAFYSSEGAAIIVDRINESVSSDTEESSQLPPQLRAELSNPKTAKDRKKKGQKDDAKNLHDLRLRRPRRAPIRKHPVITSSDKNRTNMGNKTK